MNLHWSIQITIYQRTDSDGINHQVWAQRQANACGIASLWMARGIATGQTIGESEWSLAQSMFEGLIIGTNPVTMPSPMTFPMTQSPQHINRATMANTFGEAGLMTKHIIQTLISLGFTVISTERGSNYITIDTPKLSDTTPALVRIGWYRPGGERVGGHLIVAARQASNGTIVYLDPWEGQLYQLQNLGKYRDIGQIEEVIYIS